jgi:hypothetical protein
MWPVGHPAQPPSGTPLSTAKAALWWAWGVQSVIPALRGLGKRTEIQGQHGLHRETLSLNKKKQHFAQDGIGLFFLSSIFLFFVVLELELKAYTLSHSMSSFL